MLCIVNDYFILMFASYSYTVCRHRHRQWLRGCESCKCDQALSWPISRAWHPSRHPSLSSCPVHSSRTPSTSLARIYWTFSLPICTVILVIYKLLQGFVLLNQFNCPKRARTQFTDDGILVYCMITLQTYKLKCTSWSTPRITRVLSFTWCTYL